MVHTDQAGLGLIGEKKMQVTIVKSTPKAHLVQDTEGRQAWIQARWLRDDNTVSDKTFLKGYESLSQEKQFKEDRAAFNNEYQSIGEFEKETEKAVAISAHWENFASDQSGTALVWLPKSQVVDGKVKGWLLAAKAKELKERLTSQHTTFEIVIAGHTFNV